MTSNPFQDHYARIFYPTARGYTTLNPDAFQAHSSKAHSLEGLQLGDLVLRRHSGLVHYVGINITRNANDPRNWQKLPTGYKHLLFEPGIDYIVDEARFPRPSVFLATTSASDVFDVRCVPRADAHDFEKLEFSTSATEGAYCGLPFGGSSHECTPLGLQKIQHFALEHGRFWYYQVMHVDSLDLQNGDLAVVTGCEKASYWTCGVFSSSHGSESPFKKRLVVPKVEAGIVQNVRMIEDCDEETSPTLFDHYVQSARKDTANRFEKQTCCFAFRGFRVSLKSSIYNDMRVPRTTREQLWHALPRFLRPTMKTWPVYPHQVPPYHPCTAISELVLASDKRITTAVIHDNDVLTVLEPVSRNIPLS
ncbi:hypothetical protein BDZ89DRAFT_283752 [Hymenopellis radicata]|nr:hypothetical protein BDZ89DRAFT_283752 [Hymenopellis radicata]